MRRYLARLAAAWDVLRGHKMAVEVVGTYVTGTSNTFIGPQLIANADFTSGGTFWTSGPSTNTR